MELGWAPDGGEVDIMLIAMELVLADHAQDINYVVAIAAEAGFGSDVRSGNTSALNADRDNRAVP